MRTEPLVGTKVWFKPRRFGGWGWSPASWQGWAVLGVAVGTSVVLSRKFGSDDRRTRLAGAAVAAGVLAVCVLKGTTPGGPARRAEYERLARGE